MSTVLQQHSHKAGLCSIKIHLLLAAAPPQVRSRTEVKKESFLSLLVSRSFVFLVLILPLIIWKRIGIFGPNDRSLRLKLALQAVLANLLIFCYYEGTIVND